MFLSLKIELGVTNASMNRIFFSLSVFFVTRRAVASGPLLIQLIVTSYKSRCERLVGLEELKK